MTFKLLTLPLINLTPQILYSDILSYLNLNFIGVIKVGLPLYSFLFLARGSQAHPKEKGGGGGAGQLSLSSPHGGAGGAHRPRGFWPLYTLLNS